MSLRDVTRGYVTWLCFTHMHVEQRVEQGDAVCDVYIYIYIYICIYMCVSMYACQCVTYIIHLLHGAFICVT